MQCIDSIFSYPSHPKYLHKTIYKLDANIRKIVQAFSLFSCSQSATMPVYEKLTRFCFVHFLFRWNNIFSDHASCINKRLWTVLNPMNVHLVFLLLCMNILAYEKQKLFSKTPMVKLNFSVKAHGTFSASTKTLSPHYIPIDSPICTFHLLLTLIQLWTGCLTQNFHHA